MNLLEQILLSIIALLGIGTVILCIALPLISKHPNDPY